MQQGAQLREHAGDDGFDDCDIALKTEAPRPNDAKLAEGFSRPPSRSPSPEQALVPAWLFDDCPPPLSDTSLALLADRDFDEHLPTALDCGVVGIGWSLSLGLARCVLNEADACLAAGLVVWAASLTATHAHGQATPYTERYGSATPAGVVQVAAGYLVGGILLSGWQYLG